MTRTGSQPVPFKFEFDDDGYETADRVRLATEADERYDTAFYDGLLIRAAVSICSPLGWRERRVRDYCSGTTETTLRSFTNR